MGADIRLVKMKRKAINEQSVSIDTGAISMDYFDVIEMKQFHSYDTLMDILDVGNVGQESRDDISMQSYPLYVSAK